jgi:hypothetical protein
MTDYGEFPPLKYFLRVLKNCPKSAFLYIQIWQNRGDHFCFVAKKNDIRKDYLISPTVFRNLLASLAYLNVIRICEDDEIYAIDVLGPHVND